MNEHAGLDRSARARGSGGGLGVVRFSCAVEWALVGVLEGENH